MTTIGVFDSGFGGLTVLRALLPLIPGAHYLYLGDTARLPYGAKSQATIARYAVESARFLESRGADLLVIACNTATALALDDIRQAVQIPVLGVIQPGAQAIHTALTSLSSHPQATQNLSSRLTPTPDLSSRPEAAHLAAAVERPASPPTQNLSSRPEAAPLAAAVERPASPPAPPEILVLATAATVQSHAYQRACAALKLHATEVACPLLVPLVEEGWTDHPVTREVLRIYLTEALAQCTPRAVLLGCTHYPLIASEIEQTLRNLGSAALVIDSAQATAAAVAGQLAPAAATPAPATFTCYATDSVEKFQRLGSLFLHRPLTNVHLLDLGG